MNQSEQLMENASYSWSEDSVRKIITTGAAAKNTFFYVQEVGYFKTFYPYFTERKNLSSFLIVYTISGRGQLCYEDMNYTLDSGSCFFIDCMPYHKYYVNQNDSWEFLWVHFNGSNARGYYDLFSRNGICITEFLSDRLLNQESFLSSFEALLALWEQKDRTTELIASKILTDLLTGLLLQSDAFSLESSNIPEYITALSKDIELNFKEDLSLTYFEKKYNKSRFSIEKEYKKYMGVTVTESVIRSRLSHAKELLKYSDLSVNEIAYDCGMNHVSHFIHLFKVREHFTPAAYRKEWRNE
ncbi:MAG: AraC family transcriptional regulator [Lachnospiraceae bacterium]|nr:AraC family transcriptional regulator [Lachnospiraceae bacterium]